VSELLHQYGYLGLAAAVFLNAMGVPIASEVLLPLAGVLVSQGTLDLVTVTMVAIVAQVAGFAIAYVVARHGGYELLERYGRYVWLRQAQLRKLRRLFKRHGEGLVFLGICMPGLHGYVSYPAGLAGMRFGLFLVMTVLGVSLWTMGLLGLGMALAAHLDWLGAAARGTGAVVTVAVLLLAAGIWYSKHHARG
jgi:membrane protein DedA with SNARE-associated domain